MHPPEEEAAKEHALIKEILDKTPVLTDKDMEELKEGIEAANADKWLRCRFHANLNDYRPVLWPPPGPYWCSGVGDDYSIVIAYVRSEEQLMEYWPEASEIDSEERDEITYTDRFPKPKWYDG